MRRDGRCAARLKRSELLSGDFTTLGGDLLTSRLAAAQLTSRLSAARELISEPPPASDTKDLGSRYCQLSQDTTVDR